MTGNQFSLLEGRALRDEGIAKRDRAELFDFWPRNCDRAIKVLADSGAEFTAEDVRQMVGDPPHMNSLGGRFISASRAGLIVKVGFRQATRAERHATTLAVWRGVRRSA